MQVRYQAALRPDRGMVAKRPKLDSAIVRELHRELYARPAMGALNAAAASAALRVPRALGARSVGFARNRHGLQSLLDVGARRRW